MTSGAVTALDLLRDAFDRVHDDLPGVVSGLTPDELLWRPDPEANHVAWLVWHLARVQDDHLADLAGVEQAWTADGWADRFGLPYPTDALGYGQSSDDVGAFRLEDPSLLTGYHEAVHELTSTVLDGLGDGDGDGDGDDGGAGGAGAALARVVDDRWDPPVTAAVRLVSVVNDVTQHLGQAAYLRGLLDRRR
jgi:DinB superfamily